MFVRSAIYRWNFTNMFDIVQSTSNSTVWLSRLSLGQRFSSKYDIFLIKMFLTKYIFENLTVKNDGWRFKTIDPKDNRYEAKYQIRGSELCTFVTVPSVFLCI